MAAVGSTVLTLVDWAKLLDPDGKVGVVVEILNQTNEMLADMLFMEGNLPTGHRDIIRTGLPTVFWRLLNQGTPPSKATTAQVTEQSAMLEAWSEVDRKLAELGGNVGAFRMSQGRAFIEAMNQEVMQTVIYGNSGLAPEEFTGFAPRFSDTSVANGRNILDAGGTGSDNSSIWLIVWGENTTMGIFPKGSVAGLQHEDMGLVTVQTTQGVGGNRMRAYQEMWSWDVGLHLPDWRYVARIANIDIPDLIARAGAEADLFTLMGDSLHHIQNLRAGNAAFYMNRTLRKNLDWAARQDVITGGQLSFAVVDGVHQTFYQGIPIRTVDSLIESEDQVT